MLGRIDVAHVGAQYAIDSRATPCVEWEDNHTNVFGGKPDIDQYTAGVHIAF